ncbi:MAG: PIN domain-containing protein [Opitutaceae bacterium]
MRLFLDTSVLLAAIGSAKGASRYVIESAAANQWELVTSSYCVEETTRNLFKIARSATRTWTRLIEPKLTRVPTELVLDKVLVFPKAKDRPVIISALAAEPDFLLTLDEGDFQKVIGSQVYGLQVRTPGQFLFEQRAAGNL